MSTRAPIVGITADLSIANTRPRAEVGLAYARCVHAAGAVPIILPPIAALADQHANLCDAFVFTGGDDPRTEIFGVPTHPSATPMHPDRQAYELALLDRLARTPRTPVLGVCLGMQLMSLTSGGRMDQHMPDTRPDAQRHWDHDHAVIPEPGSGFPVGVVASKHKQCITDPGRLRVLARSDDGVIEAVDDPARPFFVGVQWHPERTGDPALGQQLFDALVRAARDGSLGR